MGMVKQNFGTILIVERRISDALNLQDLIVCDGGRVLTAYSLARALLLANNAILDDAIIDFSFDGVDEIVGVLKKRKIPFMFHAGQISAPEVGLEERAPRRTRVPDYPSSYASVISA